MYNAAWVNFQNIMLGVDGKSQKTTYSLILFCEAYKHAKLIYECISETFAYKLQGVFSFV